MKKLIYSFIVLLSSITVSYAQEWLLNGTNIYNTNTGNVGIGTDAPAYKLSITSGTTFSVDPQQFGVNLHSTGTLSNYFQTNFSLYRGNIDAGILSFRILNNGYVGIGDVATPLEKLHVADGNVFVKNGSLIIDNSADATLYTGTGATELNRYFKIVNSTGLTSSSGLKAGGVLVADDYNYASPGKNDLVVKGHLGIGTTLGANPNNYSLLVGGTVNTTGLYVNDQLFVSSQWLSGTGNVSYSGKVGIGTTLASNPNNYTLAVNGKIGAKDVQVETSSSTWPDYVFSNSYALPSLNEVRSFVNKNKHLPGVPSAQEIEKNGHLLGEMDAVLLKKIEELTLYILQQQKEIEELKKAVNTNNQK